MKVKGPRGGHSPHQTIARLPNRCLADASAALGLQSETCLPRLRLGSIVRHFWPALPCRQGEVALRYGDGLHWVCDRVGRYSEGELSHIY